MYTLNSIKLILQIKSFPITFTIKYVSLNINKAKIMIKHKFQEEIKIRIFNNYS